MKTRKIRLLSALLALAMLLALLPTAAFAEDNIVDHGTCGAKGNESNVTWTLDSDGTLTISGTGAMADYGSISNRSPWSVNVPRTIQAVVIGKNVTSIGSCAFYNTTYLTNVTFEEDSNLTNIGVGAFGLCRKLTSITIPSSVTTIGQSAFVGCEELTSITIPSSVTTIGANAFEWCSGLQSVTFAPNSGLKTIGNEAFGRCHKDLIFCYSDESGKTALTKVGVSPDLIKPANPTVTFDTNNGSKVDSQKVANGKTATEPAAPTKNGYIFAGWYTDGALTEKYDFSKAVKDDMTLYAKWTPGGPCGVGGNLTWTLDGGTLTISGTGAMADYDPESILDINYPWKSHISEIKKIVIESGVTSIGNYAFYNLQNVTEAVIPDSVTSIGKYAFSGFLRDSASNAPKIESIKIPSGIQTIGEAAFSRCYHLKCVDLSDAVALKTIESFAFYECIVLEEIDLEHAINLETIGECAISGTLFNGTIIGPQIARITIPASVTNIRKYAFGNCRQLESVTFAPDSKLEAMGEDAFSGCSALKTISCDENVKQVLVKAGVDEGKIENYPPEPDPEPEKYPITIDYGTAYDADHNVITKAAKGETVYVEASETALDGMVFERWEVRKGDVKLENDHAAKTSFTMPAGEVQLEAMYQAADVHDSGWDAATVVTGVAIGTGTAVLAYHIGMEVYAEQVLGKDVAVPRTRAEVALLAWQLAGSPAVNVEGEPLSEAAQAQRWAVESGLMQKDAEGNFNGTKKMSKWNALRTLDAAKKMG